MGCPFSLVGSMGIHLTSKKLTAMDAALTSEQMNLVTAMIDPGHGVVQGKNYTGFPDAVMGRNVVVVPAVFDMDINNTAGNTVTLVVPPVPSLACMLKYAGGSEFTAIPWSHADAVAPTFPGSFMSAKGLSMVRCLSKSVTFTNITPEMYRGGMIYSTITQNQLKLTITDPDEDFGTPAVGHTPTAYGFNPHLGAYPTSPSEVMASPGYRVMDPSGIYVVARPISFEPNKASSQDYDLDTHWGQNVPDDTSRLNIVRYGTAASPKNLFYHPSNSAYSGQAAGRAVVAPCITDGCESIVISTTTPAVGANSYHIKIRALYEFSLSTTDDPFMMTLSSAPNQLLVAAVKDAFESLDTFKTDEENDLGAIMRWFKRAYNSTFVQSVARPVTTALVPGAAVAFKVADVVNNAGARKPTAQPVKKKPVVSVKAKKVAVPKRK